MSLRLAAEDNVVVTLTDTPFVSAEILFWKGKRNATHLLHKDEGTEVTPEVFYDALTRTRYAQSVDSESECPQFTAAINKHEQRHQYTCIWKQKVAFSTSFVNCSPREILLVYQMKVDQMAGHVASKKRTACRILNGQTEEGRMEHLGNEREIILNQILKKNVGKWWACVKTAMSHHKSSWRWST